MWMTKRSRSVRNGESRRESRRDSRRNIRSVHWDRSPLIRRSVPCPSISRAGRTSQRFSTSDSIRASLSYWSQSTTAWTSSERRGQRETMVRWRASLSAAKRPTPFSPSTRRPSRVICRPLPTLVLAAGSIHRPSRVSTSIPCPSSRMQMQPVRAGHALEGDGDPGGRPRRGRS